MLIGASLLILNKLITLFFIWKRFCICNQSKKYWKYIFFFNKITSLHSFLLHSVSYFLTLDVGNIIDFSFNN